MLDNGASAVKAGIAGTTDGALRFCSSPLPLSSLFVYPLARTVPNAVIRSKGDKTTYLGHEFDHCKDYSSLHYRLPFEKVLTLARLNAPIPSQMQGYLVDWDAQKAVWDGIFSDEVLGVNVESYHRVYCRFHVLKRLIPQALLS